MKTELPTSEAQEEYDVVIVGAGVAGVSSLYHLTKNVCDSKTLKWLIVDSGTDAGGVGLQPRHSGTATMPTAGCIKMMVQLFAGTCADMINHHGQVGAQRYLQATHRGLQIQKQIASDIVWPTILAQQQEIEASSSSSSSSSSRNTFINELGSYYVAYQEDETILKQEYKILKSMLETNHERYDDSGNRTMIEWCDKDRLSIVPGMSTKFYCGIYFPNDAVIDSSLYAQNLLRYILDNNHDDRVGQFWSNTRVLDVIERYENQDLALITLMEQQQDGDNPQRKPKTKQILAKHVVMATGGFYKDPNLHGLIKPCYSYLVHVPIEIDNNDNNLTTTTTQRNNNIVDVSSNFFTWGYTHDWCFVNGKIRCSGEDHFSAYKDPISKERCRNLSEWTLEQYDCSIKDVRKDGMYSSFWDDIPQQYGIYTETPDMVPLIGHLYHQDDKTINDNNNDTNNNCGGRICYMLGCNAWGQTILSYCASLIPGLLHYKEFTKEQKDILKLVSIQRFSECS